MCEIVVIDKSQFEEMLRQAGAFATSIVLEQTQVKTPELMTKTEVAEYLRCDQSKIDRLMKSGLPFEKFGATPRYRKTDIDHWLRGEKQ